MKKLLGTLILLLFPIFLRAQCTGSSPTWTSTPDESSVSTCVSNASPGDTINVTTGSGSVTWNSQLSIAKPLKIIGPGSCNSMGAACNEPLVIVDNAGSSAELIHWAGIYGTKGCASTSAVCFRFSGFSIEPVSGTTNLYSIFGLVGACTSASCPNIRIDNNSFTGWTKSNGNYATWLILTDNVFGVIDHNFVSNEGRTLANPNHSAYLGVGSHGDNSWAAPDSFGTANALYFENNTYDSNQVANNDCDAPPSGGTVGGCRIVIRFNNFSGTAGAPITNHGTESAGRNRGGRQIETYANSIYCNSSNGCASVTGFRSGTLLQWGNHLTTFGTSTCSPNCSWFNDAVSFSDYRTYVNFPPWGVSDGSSPYDTNDGTVYDSGAYTGTTGSQNFTDTSKSWTTNQWAGSAVTNGTPYSIRNVTRGWSEQIASNTSNTITPAMQAICHWGSSTPCTWTNGDSYQIRRASVTIDQPARGSGVYYSGGTANCAGYSTGASPCSAANEALDPIYEWADSVGPCTAGWPNCVSGSTFHGYNFGVVSGIGEQIIANRDYYTETQGQSAQTNTTSPFNGSSAVGHGTLANRPPTCSTGVAYWAVDQGSWNTNNTTIPGTPGYTQGQLYVCTSTNTWSLHYTPYTYPHPLIGGSTTPTGTAGDPPNPPTGLTATVQ